MKHVAYFITPHGFGHAARACAVIEAWQRTDPFVSFHIFTTVPVWFFEESLTGKFQTYQFLTDVGLKQKDPFSEDLEETVNALAELYPLKTAMISSLAQQVSDLGCQLILCDIAPVGIAAANKLGIKSVLIENFTWDWIYHEYSKTKPELEVYIDYLQNLYRQAGLHIQATPACKPDAAAVRTAPIGRQPRTNRQQIRQLLGIPDQRSVILITMGGVPMSFGFLDLLKEAKDYSFVILGPYEQPRHEDNLILLPQNSGYYHPDLVGMSDLVVSKLGYSTVAEVYCCNIPLLFVARQSFREAVTLREFALTEISAKEISESDFRSGNWLDHIPSMLTTLKRQGPTTNGAEQALAEISKFLES